jgi:hypothetical protein
LKEKTPVICLFTYKDSKLSVRGQLDHFEKWLGICKLPKNTNNSHNAMRPVMNEQDICKEVKDSVESFDDYEPKAKKQRQCLGKQSPFTIASSERDWIARRVDFILSPYSQYYYALVGWTGSKQFNRDLRLYSQKVLSRKLTSHGLHDFTSSLNTFSEKVDDSRCPHKIKLSFSSLVNSLDKNSTSFPSSG